MQGFSIQVDLGCTAWLCTVVNEELIRDKKGGFSRFYKGSSYRLILECCWNKGGNFFKILKIKNGGIRNIVIPGAFAFQGWEKFKGCFKASSIGTVIRKLKRQK